MVPTEMGLGLTLFCSGPHGYRCTPSQSTCHPRGHSDPGISRSVCPCPVMLGTMQSVLSQLKGTLSLHPER